MPLTAVGNGRGCCDNEAKDSPQSGAGCTDPCDNFFVFYLRDFGSTTHDSMGPNTGLVDLTDCSRSNRAQTGNLEENNDNLTFTVGQPFPKSPSHSEVPNPVQHNGSN